jgi:branched-chain amino acid transport system permease protein
MRRIAGSGYGVVLLIAVLVAVLPFVLPSLFYVRIAALVFIFALAVLGLNLLMGFAGQVSLGHAGFFGIGAYAVAVAPTHLSIPSWAAIVGGGVLAGLIAYVVGRPILRLKGHYLAVATLGMGLMIAMVFTNEARWTGGPDGMPVPRLEVLGTALRGSLTWYWISGATLVIGAALAINLIDSPTGRAFRAVHDSETAARVLGIDVARYKLTAFMISAAYAAIAGSLFVHAVGFVSPEVFGLPMVVMSFTMLYVGGIGTIAGPALGAIIISVLPESFRTFKDYQDLAYGAALIVILIYAPRGLASLPELSARWRRRSA